jgi:hypothetical protein
VPTPPPIALPAAAQTPAPHVIDICEEEGRHSSSVSNGNWMKDNGSFDTSNSKHKLSESEESGKKEGATPKRQKLESLDSSESKFSSLLSFSLS